MQRVHDHIDDLLAGHAIQQVRELSLTLRPAMLDDFGLVTALKTYVERQKQRAGFGVQLEARTSGERLAGEAEVA